MRSRPRSIDESRPLLVLLSIEVKLDQKGFIFLGVQFSARRSNVDRTAGARTFDSNGKVLARNHTSQKSFMRLLSMPS